MTRWFAFDVNLQSNCTERDCSQALQSSENNKSRDPGPRVSRTVVLNFISFILLPQVPIVAPCTYVQLGRYLVVLILIPR